MESNHLHQLVRNGTPKVSRTVNWSILRFTTTKITKSIRSSSTEGTADHGFLRTRTTGGVPFRARRYLSQFMAREMTEQSS
uniref:Uncharacterized protein n=1 Tax=Caenorhabditis japonica TaxID=281687 RepID=A0A8R1DR59_CAEJA